MFPQIANGVAVYPYKIESNIIQILQVQRAENDDVYPASWQCIYGSANDGEKAEETAKRELMEETELTPLRMFMLEHLETFFFRPSNSIIHMPVFAAEIASDAVPVLNEEHDAYRWVQESEINEKFVWRSQRAALKVLIETLLLYPNTIPLLLV